MRQPIVEPRLPHFLCLRKNNPIALVVGLKEIDKV
jgi:hypothetical protein